MNCKIDIIRDNIDTINDIINPSSSFLQLKIEY